MAILCLCCTIKLQAQGISINTIQLSDILWEAPVTRNDTLFKSNETDIRFTCHTLCNAPLMKEDFCIWVDNIKLLTNNITVLNNKLSVTIHLDPEKDHYVYIKVIKGKDFITTSTIHIVRIPKLPEPKRYAFLIANSSYSKGVSSLNDIPIDDINVLQKSLTTLGFKVDTSINQSRESMLNNLDTFVEKAKQADIVFYYYAGHGIQTGGVNYLVPTDANFKTTNDIPIRAIGVQSIIDKLDETEANYKIVVLDACRNDGVVVAVANARNFGGERGFSTIAGVKATGAYIVNSTQPNKGAANNGLFAKQLASQLQKGKSITEIFRMVRKSVKDASNGNQEPDINDKLDSELTF